MTRQQRCAEMGHPGTTYNPWWPQVTTIKVQRRRSREDALLAERQAISTEAPIHNIARPKGC